QAHQLGLRRAEPPLSGGSSARRLELARDEEGTGRAGRAARSGSSCLPFCRGERDLPNGEIQFYQLTPFRRLRTPRQAATARNAECGPQPVLAVAGTRTDT